MPDSNPNDRVIKFFRLKELKTGATILTLWHVACYRDYARVK